MLTNILKHREIVSLLKVYENIRLKETHQQFVYSCKSFFSLPQWKTAL